MQAKNYAKSLIETLVASTMTQRLCAVQQQYVCITVCTVHSIMGFAMMSIWDRLRFTTLGAPKIWADRKRVVECLVQWRLTLASPVFAVIHGVDTR